MCHPQAASDPVVVLYSAVNFVYSGTDVIGIAGSGCGTVVDMIVVSEIVANVEHWIGLMRRQLRRYLIDQT